MTAFTAVLTPMLTLFLCIAAGYTFSKCKILPEGAGKVMARLETWIFCPALNFMTMVRFCTPDSIGTHFINIMLSAIGVAFAMTLAILLSRLFIKQKSPERGIYAYGLAFANGGYMGDPIVLALFGEAALAYYKLFYLPFSLMINSWGIGLLTPNTGKKGEAWLRLLNPSTVAMLAGIAVGLSRTGNYLPVFLINSLDMLKACMGPVAMLLAGVIIAKYDLFAMLKKTKVYVASVLRLVVLPVIQIALLFGIKTLISKIMGQPIGNDVLFLMLIATATPLGLNTIVFPEAYGGNPETGASMAIISHTLCVITIPSLYALAIAVFGTPFGL